METTAVSPFQMIHDLLSCLLMVDTLSSIELGNGGMNIFQQFDLLLHRFKFAGIEQDPNAFPVLGNDEGPFGVMDLFYERCDA